MKETVVETRLRAFIGRSFLKEDDPVWSEVRKILESLRSLGFSFEDAAEAQVRPISDKVRAGIERNNIYIGILTRRVEIPAISRFGPLAWIHRGGSRWTSSEWVIEEAGYALGRGRKIILMKEQGVQFPSSDLDADTEWIEFSRESIREVDPKLVSMIVGLISDTLPGFMTAATAPAAEPTDIAAGQVTTTTTASSHSWEEITALLDQGEYQKADELFNSFVEKAQVEIRGPLRYLYLQTKSIKGDSGSVEKLRRIVQEHPDDIDARLSLSNYFREFGLHEDSIRVLEEGECHVSKPNRVRLLRYLSARLAGRRLFEAGFNALRRALQDEDRPEERALIFTSLAEVAKELSDRELQSAALEQAMILNPTDAKQRFQLAYVYGEAGKRHLALHHYRIRLAQGWDEVTMNNLGAAHGELGMKAKEVEDLEKSASTLDLAKANLSHIYADGSFLVVSERMAQEVVSATGDDQARSRAAAALDRIKKQREEETALEKKILLSADEQGRFLAAYAEAFVSELKVPVDGTYLLPQGNIDVHYRDGRLLGEMTTVEQVSRSSLWMALVGKHGPAETVTRTRTLRFSAELAGRSARYTLGITEQDEGHLPKTTSVAGLMVIDVDGTSLRLLEHGDPDSKVYTAARKN